MPFAESRCCAFFFFPCFARFRAVIIVSVSTSKKKKPHAPASFFPHFCFVWSWNRYFFLPVLFNPEERRNRLSSAMGDTEAPESNRPRQTVLLSILPSKEFATSRKGMLLLAEVVRNERNLWNRWSRCFLRGFPKFTRVCVFGDKTSNSIKLLCVFMHIVPRKLNVDQASRHKVSISEGRSINDV